MSAALSQSNSLTLTELRERLSALGESSSTPGIAGEARRQILLSRFIDAVGGKMKEDKEEEERVRKEGYEKYNDMPAAVYRRLPPSEQSVSAVPQQPVHQHAPPPVKEEPLERDEQEDDDGDEVDDDDVVGDDRALSQAELNEVKRQLKRLQNQRAVSIAAQLDKDSRLISMESTLSKIALELRRLSVPFDTSAATATAITSGRGGSSKQSSYSHSHSNNSSSVLVDNGQIMPKDKLLARLTSLQAHVKEEV